MTLYVKNMVCIRCRMAVKSELENMGLKKMVIRLGEVKINETISRDQLSELKNALNKRGFELADQNESLLIEKIKKIIIDIVHYSDDKLVENISDILSKKLNCDYATLNALFLKIQTITIENYFLTHKIERIKELLVYYRLNLNEIAYQLNYSSIAHLTNQFKAVTGLSPAHYRKIKAKRYETQGNV